MLLSPSAWRYLTLQRGDLNSAAVSLLRYFFSPAFNSDQELLYSSLFLKYMRYKHETFTKEILKNCFISLPYNLSALYLSNGRRWFRSWEVYGTLWNIFLNRTLLHIHYTNTVFLSAGPLCRPHIFCEVSPSFLWGESAPGNVFPWGAWGRQNWRAAVYRTMNPRTVPFHEVLH
jgi:hypothetical protein